MLRHIPEAHACIVVSLISAFNHAIASFGLAKTRMRLSSGSLKIWYMRARPNTAGLGAMMARKFVRFLAAFASDSIRLDETDTRVSAEQSQRTGHPETKVISSR